MKKKKKINIKEALKDFWNDVRIWRVMYLVLASIDLLLCAVLLIGSFGKRANDQNNSNEIESAQVHNAYNATDNDGSLELAQSDLNGALWTYLVNYLQYKNALSEYVAVDFNASFDTYGYAQDELISRIYLNNSIYINYGGDLALNNNEQIYLMGANWLLTSMTIYEQGTESDLYNGLLDFYGFGDDSVVVPDGYTLYDVDFTFNENLNPYGYLSGQSNGYFAQGSGQNRVVFDGLFTYQGKEYNYIKMQYIAGASIRYGTSISDNSVASSTASNICAYMYMTFENADESIATNYRRYIVGDTFSVMTSEQYWILDGMRHIHIVYAKDGLNNSDYDAISYLSLGNNGYSQGNSVPGFSGNTDVFALIGSAFSSLVSLMNISILPGLTIGVLAIIPFVISVVLLVVWLFKR